MWALATFIRFLGCMYMTFGQAATPISVCIQKVSVAINFLLGICRRPATVKVLRVIRSRQWNTSKTDFGSQEETMNSEMGVLIDRQL